MLRYVAMTSVFAGIPGGFENANRTEMPSLSKTVRGGMVGSAAGVGAGLNGDDVPAFPVPLRSANGSDAARGGGAETGVRGCGALPPISAARGSCALSLLTLCAERSTHSHRLLQM